MENMRHLSILICEILKGFTGQRVLLDDTLEELSISEEDYSFIIDDLKEYEDIILKEEDLQPNRTAEDLAIQACKYDQNNLLKG